MATVGVKGLETDGRRVAERVTDTLMIVTGVEGWTDRVHGSHRQLRAGRRCTDWTRRQDIHSHENHGEHFHQSVGLFHRPQPSLHRYPLRYRPINCHTRRVRKGH